MNKENNETLKKQNNKILIIVVILVIIIGVVGSLLLLNKNSKNNKENNQPNKVVKKRTGKKLTIYKTTDSNGVSGDSYDFEESEEINGFKVEEYGKVTCLTDDCIGATAFSNYAIIEEAEGAYLINVKTDELYYGPFGTIMTEEDDENYDKDDKFHLNYSFVDDGNVKVNAIVVSDEDSSLVFDVKNKKEHKNLKGILYDEMYSNKDKATEYGYILLNKVDIDDDYPIVRASYVYDLKTGKLLSEYNKSVDIFAYDENVYILYNPVDYSEEDSLVTYTYIIKDVNGNSLFNNKKFIQYNVENDNLLLYDNNYFYLYDNNLELVRQSNKYNSILMAGKDFVLVNNNNLLQLVDLNDKLLTTFIKNFNNKSYYVHTMLSGWYTEKGKNGIYIVVAQKNVNINEVLKNHPDMTKSDLNGVDLGYEYYYIPTTKETGKIATYIGGYAKPVLYLYPTKTTKVEVGFKYPELLTTTYPKFNKSWKVTVDKNGNITDNNGRNYYGLYWEEKSNKKISFDTGFYVESEEAIKFLEEKLAIIGLNERESNEFIMYWLPILEKNKKSLVYFELTEERENFNKLFISPKPDSLLRVAIHIKKVTNKVDIKEQQLKTFNRKGFSAIEWGGYSY